MRKHYYILLFLCFCSCNKTEKPTHVKEIIGLKADFNLNSSEIKAGEKFTISGKIKNQTKSQLRLILDHALYTKSYSVKIQNNQFQIEIPGEDNQIAGEVKVFLFHQDKLIQKSSYFIKPLDAIDKMQNFNGPKDLFAGDDDGSMNVSIPHDQFENPLLPPSVVVYQSSYNGVTQTTEEKPIENLISYQITKSKTQKGKYLIGSKSKQGFSKEQELLIGASMPKSFNIELLSFHPFADSRQFIQLKTSVLKDKYDNIIADGTLINFTIEEAESLVGVYQSFTIGGIANVYIENPSQATSWIIQASLHDEIKSNRIPLSFSKNVNDFDLLWDNKSQTLSIGPVVGILGQFVPDGTEVIISNEQKELETYIYLEEGKYSYQLPFDWIEKSPKQLKVLIGGQHKIIKID